MALNITNPCHTPSRVCNTSQPVEKVLAELTKEKRACTMQTSRDEIDKREECAVQ
jgi:hypothetical protein